MKILVVENDKQTLEYIAQGLRERGHSVDIADDGLEGLALAQNSIYDVLVLDRMLPNMDGLSLLQTVRQKGIRSPTLFLTAMSRVEDRVIGLQAGGDDYLIKPFAFEELYARIISLARRPPLEESATVLQTGDLKMNLLRRKVTRSNQKIELQPMEFKLLEILLKNMGRVVTRTMLLERVWDIHFDPKTNVVETHISRLRSKIDRGFNVQLIQTVRGVGYTIDELREND